MISLLWNRGGKGGKEERKGTLVKSRDPSYKVVESYWVHNPFAKVTIVSLPGSEGSFQYFVEEAPLDGREREAWKKLVAILRKELRPPETLETDISTYVLNEAKRIAHKYRRSLGKFDAESWEKIFYYVVRDLAGYGDLNVLMLDPNIEDISCNGLNRPIYIWHRKYESIPTNIEFVDEIAYNNFVLKLAHMAGKHISSANPILDAMLPEKHRLAATFMREVSTFGSTFCIRKFRSDPFSIVDLIKLGTLDERIAAYLWVLLENKMNIMIIGGTGAGKTSMLNALTTLIMPNDKIITVEEIAELNPPRQNWVQLVSRRAFRFGSSDTTSISLFDLVKVSLRYRPDYIVVGEIRGEEAYVLFQAVATGHGGLCTMHADSLDHAVKRLTSPPMNVSEVYIPLMNLCIYVARVDLPKKKGGLSFGRRIIKMWEIVDYGKYNLISEWIPSKDRFRSNFSKSILLEKIAAMRGVKKSTILKEINERRKAIRKMIMLNMNGKEVAQAVMNYYEGKPVEAAKRLEAETAEERKAEPPKKTKKTARKRKRKTSKKKETSKRKRSPKKKVREKTGKAKASSKDGKKKGGTKKG